MKKKVVIIVAAALLALGIGSVLYYNIAVQEGISYEPLDKGMLKQPYDSMSQIGYTFLYYHERMYTSNWENRVTCFQNDSLEEFDNVIDKLKLTEVSDVYTYDGNCWSEDRKELYEPERKSYTRWEGKLYEMKGFGKDRLCLCSKAEYQSPFANDGKPVLSYSIEIYTCLNGVTFAYGKDIFRDTLHLEDMKKVSAGKWEEFSEESDFEISVDPKEKVFSSFLSALNEGKMLSEQDAGELTKKMEEQEDYLTCHLDNCFIFESSFGNKIVIYIFPERYAVYLSPEQTPFMIQLDEKLYNQIIEKYFS